MDRRRCIPIDRFWSKVDVRGEDECWHWLGSKDARGYGRIGLPVNGRTRPVGAHRVSYEIANGAVAAGPSGPWAYAWPRDNAEDARLAG